MASCRLATYVLGHASWFRTYLNEAADGDVNIPTHLVCVSQVRRGGLVLQAGSLLVRIHLVDAGGAR